MYLVFTLIKKIINFIMIHLLSFVKDESHLLLFKLLMLLYNCPPERIKRIYLHLMLIVYRKRTLKKG